MWPGLLERLDIPALYSRYSIIFIYIFSPPPPIETPGYATDPMYYSNFEFFLLELLEGIASQISLSSIAKTVLL